MLFIKLRKFPHYHFSENFYHGWLFLDLSLSQSAKRIHEVLLRNSFQFCSFLLNMKLVIRKTAHYINSEFLFFSTTYALYQQLQALFFSGSNPKQDHLGNMTIPYFLLNQFIRTKYSFLHSMLLQVHCYDFHVNCDVVLYSFKHVKTGHFDLVNENMRDFPILDVSAATLQITA